MDLQFEVLHGKFNCRTCAIIKSGNAFLFHKKKQDEFWSLIGGKVKFLEDSAIALKRELREELHITVNPEKPVIIAENYFTLNSEQFHEILFIYLVECEHLKADSFSDKNFDFQWLYLDDLLNVTIKPGFLDICDFARLVENREISLEHRIYADRSLDFGEE